MSLTLYRARRSRVAAERRAAILTEMVAVGAALVLIAVVGAIAQALFQL